MMLQAGDRCPESLVSLAEPRGAVEAMRAPVEGQCDEHLWRDHAIDHRAPSAAASRMMMLLLLLLCQVLQVQC